MSRAAAERPTSPDRPARDGAAAALLAALTTCGAVALKARCGVPATRTEEYLGYCYSDVVPLWGYLRLDVGAVPYLDHPVEYPPLTGLWMWLAALPAESPGQFLAATAVLLVASAAVAGWLLGRNLGLARACAFALAPTLLVSGALNWDLPSVALATGGLVAHRRGHDRWAGVLLGLGAAAKAWPALLVPGVALGALALRGRRAGVRSLLWSAGAWAVVNAPVALVAPAGWWRFFALSRERPVDWDSLWRVVPALGGGAGFADPDGLVAVLTLLGIAGLLVAAVRTTPPSTWHLVGLPVLAWFLLVGKVWSPQFTLWLLPLLALARPRAAGLVALAVTDVAVTATRFPHLAGAVGLDGIPGWPFELAVVLRAVVVAWLALDAWRRATRTDTGGGAAGARDRPATAVGA